MIPLPSSHSSNYWVGRMSSTIAHAVSDPAAAPLLRTTLAKFLAERPPGDPLGDLLRAILKEKKP